MASEEQVKETMNNQEVLSSIDENTQVEAPVENVEENKLDETPDENPPQVEPIPDETPAVESTPDESTPVESTPVEVWGAYGTPIREGETLSSDNQAVNLKTPKPKSKSKAQSKPKEPVEKLSRAEMAEIRDIWKQMENLLNRAEKIDGIKDKMLRFMNKDRKKQITINGETIKLNDSNCIVIDVI